MPQHFDKSDGGSCAVDTLKPLGVFDTGSEALAEPRCESTDRERRIDPRVAFAVLLILNVQAGLSQSLAFEFASVALGIACMAYCGRFASILRWLGAYLFFLALGYALVVTGSTALASFAAVFLVYRHVFPIFMFASNMIATTRVGELACAMQSLRFSSKMTVALCVAMRFFPTVGREFAAVKDAMRTRGISLSPLSVVRHPIKTIERFMVPVVGRVGIVADELGNAVVVRGVETQRKRTSYYRLKITAVDAAVVLVAVLTLTASLMAKTGLIA